MPIFSFDPSAVPPGPSYDALPDIPAIRLLKSKRQWVAWKYELLPNGRWTKPPLSPHTGFKASSTNPQTWGTYQQAADRARRSNLAGIGFALLANGGFVGGDLDHCRNSETGEIEAWAAAIVAIAETYTEISPSGEGLRLIWEGNLVTGIKLESAQVEIYGQGRYLTITGDHLPGTPIEIRSAPKTQEALLARVEAFKAEKTEKKEATPPPLPKPASTSLLPTSQPSDFFHRVKDAALQNLSAWVLYVFPHAKLQSGTRAYRISSSELGRDLEEDLSISPLGIVDFGIHDMGDARDGKRTAIDIVIDHGGAPDAKAAAFWLCERLGVSPASLGWEDGSEREKIGATRAAEILDAPIDPTHPLDSLTLGRDIDWTRPQGLLADIAEWILSSSRRPNRPFAVAAALAALSPVCGRHLFAPTGTALNIYLICLAPTGVGKGRPLGAVAELLQAAKLDSLQSTGKMFSVSALEDLIKDQPSCVATVDEIGSGLLARISHPRASSHEMQMRATLLELWSREQGAPPFATHGRAQSKSAPVPSPSFSLFGVSTPESFYNAVTTGSVKDGFLNRFLITAAAPRAKANDVSEEARAVPSGLVRGLLDLVPEGEGDFGRAAGIFSPNVNPKGRRLPWDCHQTKELASLFEEQILAQMDANPEHAGLMGRIFEYSVRLGSLHAVSRAGRAAKVTAKDLAWGASLAIQSTRALIDGTSALMAANDYEAKFNLVRNVIREAKQIGRYELLRRVRSINAREREEIIRHLKEGRWIVDASIKSDGGRTALGWRWTG